MDNDDLLHQLLSLPEKDKTKLLKSLIQDENLSPQRKMYLSKLASQEAVKNLKQNVEDDGKIPTKRIDPEMSTEGFTHMLETRSTTDETITHVQQTFNQPDEWAIKVRNREIPVAQRKENINHLKSRHKESNIPLLKHLLEQDYTSFREIQEPRTYSKQLQHLENIIRMSDQIDDLRKEVDELNKFKERQYLFNQAVVYEIEHQKDIMDGIMESLPLNITERNIKLTREISLLDTEQEKLKYLLARNLNKAEIANILGVSRSTVKRRCKKYKLEITD